MTRESVDLVRRFCAAFSSRDPDRILDFFTDDAVYHNMPMRPVQGKTAIRPNLEMFLGPAERVEFTLLNIAADGDLVLTERLDRFVTAGRAVELPVAGVFEIRDGKIAAWRDYFDTATWSQQTTAR